MFIFWGEFNSEKERGFVGDTCAHCGRVTTLRVSQHYRTSHIYFIPLGSGKLVATILTCSDCNGQAGGSIDAYPRLLPKATTMSMSIGQILEETNPRLTEALVYRANLEKNAREFGDRAPGAPDPRVELAFARLADLNRNHPDVIRFQSRLSQWDALDSMAQSQVIDDIDTLVQEQGQLQAIVRFLYQMGRQFKPDVDPGPAILAFLVTAALGITGAVTLLSDTALVVGVIAAIVGAIVAAVLAQRQLLRYTHRKFFRTTFLPEAHYQAVNTIRAIDALKQINPPDQESAAGIRGMIKALPLLHEVLKEANPDGDVADALASLAASYPARRQPSGSFRWVKPVVLLGIVLAAVGGLFWIASVNNEKIRVEAELRNAYLAPFVARLPEYTPAAPVKVIQAPYRRGKVMPITDFGFIKNIDSIDDMLLYLPDDLRPNRPEDVGTIVWLEWGRNKVGVYSDNVEAVVITCKATLIDKSKGLIIAERDFVGGPPPVNRRAGDPNHGPKPTGEIIGWLASMPVQ